MDPTYPLFPILAFFGFILPLIPLPWHLLAWNSGTCYFMIWASLSSLNQFVNSIVWHNNALNTAPIWCDISIRIMMGTSVGIPAASLCIARRLYHIANIQSVAVTTKDKRRAIAFDTLICVVFPLVFIPLQYIIQGHRFNIYEDIGCYPSLYNTLPTYFIFFMWPVILGVVCAVYCGLTLRAFIRRRAEFGQFLSSNASLTVSRYFRLMALAMAQMTFMTPLAIATIAITATATPINPWVSWEETHFNWGAVHQIPALLWRSNGLVAACVEFTRWTTIFCPFVFFVFFGFSEEARKSYKKGYTFCLKLVGLQRSSGTSKSLFVNTAAPKAFELPLYSPSKAIYDDRKPTPTSPTQYSAEDTVFDGSVSGSPKVDIHDFVSYSVTERNERRFTM